MNDIHKNFDNFLKNPTHDTLGEFLTENFGEISYLYDFKKEWPTKDWSKMAKHILGFSNSGGGGMIVGVEQNKDNTFSINGLNNLIDHSKIDQAIRKYIPDKIKYDLLDFPYDNTYNNKKLAGKKFQVIIIKDLPIQIPFISLSDGIDIKKGIVYVRRQGSTEPATHEELQDIVHRRCTETSSSVYLKPVANEWKYTYQKDVIIEKGKHSLLGEFRTELLSITDHPMVATIEISIPDYFRKKVSFGSGGAYILEEKYVIDIWGISKSPDRVQLKIGDLKLLTKKEMLMR